MAILRRPLAIFALGLTAALAVPADAAKTALGVIRIDGVDNVCSGFKVGAEDNVLVFSCLRSDGGPPPPPLGPTGCVATVNSTTAAVLPSGGGSADLAVTCDSPTTATLTAKASILTYDWSRNGVPGANTSKGWTDTATSNPLLGPNTSSIGKVSSYQVQVCKGLNCVTVPTTPLSVTVPPGGAGVEPWNHSCPGFRNTRVITLDWNNPTRMFTAGAGHFGPDDVVVVQFTTGNVSSGGSLPRIYAVESDSTPSSRTAVVSSKPCDFGTQPTFGATIVGNTVTAVFAIGSGSGFGFYPVIPTNSTWYLNIKNDPNSSCVTTGSCDMYIDLRKAEGL